MMSIMKYQSIGKQKMTRNMILSEIMFSIGSTVAVQQEDGGTIDPWHCSW